MRLVVKLKGDFSYLESQAEVIHAWARERNIWHKFNKLQDSSEYTFNDLGNSRHKTDKTHDLELFLGQSRNHQTWALVRIFPRKASEVVFVNKFADGDTEVVQTFSEIALQYPFRVFKKMGSKENMRHLKTFILYAYLDAGHIEKVFPDGLTTAKSLLGPAVDIINTQYEEKGKLPRWNCEHELTLAGGVDFVPNYHEPEPLSAMSYSDDADTDVETLPKERRPRRTMRKKLKTREKAFKVEKGKGKGKATTGAMGISDRGPEAASDIPSVAFQSMREEPIDDVRDVRDMSRSMHRMSIMPMPDVMARLKRGAASESAFEQYNNTKKRKAADDARLEDIKRRKKELIARTEELAALENELSTRSGQYDDELEKILNSQPKQELVRWFKLKSREEHGLN